MKNNTKGNNTIRIRIESFLPYELTPEQLDEGWTVDAWNNMAVYKKPNLMNHDPAPGVPAWNIWWPNGAKKYEGFYQDGVMTAETSWLEDGRREDFTDSSFLLYDILLGKITQ